MRIVKVKYCDEDYPSSDYSCKPTAEVETRSLPFFKKKRTKYLCYKVGVTAAYWRNIETGEELDSFSTLAWKLNAAMALAQVEYMAEIEAEIQDLKNNS